MARPRKPIDWEAASVMYQRGATDVEVAAALGISVDTLTRRRARLASVKTEAAAKRNWSLRRKLFDVAMNDKHKSQGRILERLAKTYLGMHEVVKVDIDERRQRLATLLGVPPDEIQLE